jgi:hypothetical protein
MASQVFISKATEVFGMIDTRSMFIVIHEYTNNYNEIATYSLCWHVNYLNSVQKSYDIITAFKPTADFCTSKLYNLQDLKAARNELVDSLADTLVLGPGNNPRATSAHAYDQVLDKNKLVVPGVKIHRDQDVLHLTDVYRLNKIVHKEGVYPVVKSANKTIAKNDLRKMLPLRKWGQFLLTPGRFTKLSVQKMTVKDYDCIRNL